MIENLLHKLLVVIITLIVAPIIGGLLFGLDRRLTARLQSRVGPPLLQPFLDVLKLFSKTRIVVNKLQIICVWSYMFCIVLSLLLFVLKQDLLLIAFVLTAGDMFFILGGFCVKSPYSQIGSQREILQMLSYEPLLMFFIVGIYLKTGSFSVKKVFEYNQPLINFLPLFIFAIIIIFLIKLRKSPFDISDSNHAHQELIRGISTEFSGPYLALVEITHWFELVLLMGLASLLWAPHLVIGFIIAFVCFIIVIHIDNITARLTWSWMLKFTWTFGVSISVINLLAIYWIKVNS